MVTAALPLVVEQLGLSYKADVNRRAWLLMLVKAAMWLV